jgi:hypothetical protein
LPPFGGALGPTNGQPMADFLSDFCWIRHRIFRRFRDIGLQSLRMWGRGSCPLPVRASGTLLIQRYYCPHQSSCQFSSRSVQPQYTRVTDDRQTTSLPWHRPASLRCATKNEGNDNLTLAADFGQTVQIGLAQKYLWNKSIAESIGIVSPVRRSLKGEVRLSNPNFGQ